MILCICLNSADYKGDETMGQEAEERVMQDAESIAQGTPPVPPQGTPPVPPQETPPAPPKQPVRISSPEQVDDYIRVTTPGMWLLVAAILVLLTAGIIWAFSVKLEMKTTDQSGQVTTEYVTPSSFLTDGATAGN